MKKLYLVSAMMLLNSGYAILAMETSTNSSKSYEDECVHTYLRTHNPPSDVIEKLHTIFPDPNFFNLLEEQEEPIVFLQQRGFTPLQYSAKKFDAVVLHTNELPEYVLKFMRASAPTTKKSNARGSIPVQPIVTRIIHAEAIKKIINDLNIVHITIPHKFFYCINNIALVIANKVSNSERTIKDLVKEEIVEILELVFTAHGMLDLRERNIMFTNDKIVFIDTERDIIADDAQWKKDFKLEAERLKKSINGAQKVVVDQWLREHQLD